MPRFPHARWSVDARRVLVLAQEEADRRRGVAIGTTGAAVLRELVGDVKLVVTAAERQTT